MRPFEDVTTFDSELQLINAEVTVDSLLYLLFQLLHSDLRLNFDFEWLLYTGKLDCQVHLPVLLFKILSLELIISTFVFLTSLIQVASCEILGHHALHNISMLASVNTIFRVESTLYYRKGGIMFSRLMMATSISATITLFFLLLVLVNKVIDFLLGKTGLVVVLLEVGERILEVVDLLIVR